MYSNILFFIFTMKMLVRTSLHGHGPESHGGNIFVESLVKLEEKLFVPKIRNFVDSTSDHDSTRGLPIFREEAAYKGLDWPHICQIEISSPMHFIFTGPYETINGMERRCGLPDILRRNKENIKKKRFDAVASELHALFDDFAGGNDKVIVAVPHPFDTLKAGVAGKMPAETTLDILKNKNVHSIEIHNGMNSKRGNYLNATFGIVMNQNYGKKLVVGADYHSYKMLGTNLNIIETEGLDETSMLKGIQKGPVGFEGLVTNKVEDLMYWSIERVRRSKRDMLLKNCNNDWIKEGRWMGILKYRPTKNVIAKVIEYTDKNPYSGWWTFFTNIARGVNYIYETVQMNPKYRKVIMEATGNRVDHYDSISYDDFKKDPLMSLETIANVPSEKRRCIH